MTHAAFQSILFQEMSKNSKDRSDQAREVAEILISNSADHSSQSLTRYHMINNMPTVLHDSLYHNEDYLRETLAAGSPREGRISAVRRFFCLFVTFDFLFTALLWIICLVVSERLALFKPPNTLLLNFCFIYIDYRSKY